MLFENNEEFINYLVNLRKKGFEPKSKKEQAIEFTKYFNEEAKKQNSKWFAEWKEHKSMFEKNDSFILLHIHKRLISGWWIFKNITTISLHIGCYDGNHYSFVGNDYVISKYGEEENNRIFRYLPELRPILREISLVFNILPKEKIHNLEIDLARIEKDIKELETKIK